jgi:hypothetical protein
MYTPNNIRFRIVSSVAIAQFKQDQAFDFNELINNEAYSFSTEARETLLLNYEVWFKFICHLERIFIRSLHNKDLILSLADVLRNMAVETLKEVNDVIQTHPSIFHSSDPTTALVAKAHLPFSEHVFATIAESKDSNMYVAFPKIVNAISNSLHNLLFILHEVENLKKQDGNAFLSLTEEILEIREQRGIFPLCDRAKLYREEYNVQDFLVKNYTGKPVDPVIVGILQEAGIYVTGVFDLNNFEHSACDHLHTDKIAN